MGTERALPSSEELEAVSTLPAWGPWSEDDEMGSLDYLDHAEPRLRRGRALVLGAKGKLGRALTRRALPRYFFNVVGLDHASCDITKEDAVEAVLGAHRPQVVFNAAAFNDVDAAERRSARAFRVNALAPDWLATLCSRRGVRLVHFSTNYVFSGRSERPYREIDPPEPVNAYGASKAEGEAAVLARGRKEHVVLRVCNLYDETGPCFVRTVLLHALRHGAVDVVGDRQGALTWVEPLAFLAARVATGAARGILHAAPPDSAPFDEMARAVLEVAGVDAEVRTVEGRQQAGAAPRPARARLDTRRLETLGLPPLSPWREGLEEFFERRGAELLTSVRAEVGAEGE